MDSLKVVYIVLDTTKELVVSSKMPRLGLHAEKFASIMEYQTDSTSKAQNWVFLQKARLWAQNIFFSFVTSISMSHNSYKLKEGMFQLHIRNTFFPMMIIRYWNRLPKEAPVLSNLCPWIFSTLNQTKTWAMWAEFNVDPALCRRLDWRPPEATSSLNGSMIYWLCICVAIIPIAKKSFFSLIVYSVT